MVAPRYDVFFGSTPKHFIGYAGFCDVWLIRRKGRPRVFFFDPCLPFSGPYEVRALYAYPMTKRWRVKNGADKRLRPSNEDFELGRQLVELFHGGFFDA